MSTQVIKGIALATALSIGALTFASPAEAGRRYHRNYNYGGAAAAAIIGLGVGAALASRPYYYGFSPYAYGPPPAYGYAPPPTYAYAPAPWTPDWYAYCASRYRSFDRYSGTYQPYHGPRRLCR